MCIWSKIFSPMNPFVSYVQRALQDCMCENRIIVYNFLPQKVIDELPGEAC